MRFINLFFITFIAFIFSNKVISVEVKLSNKNSQSILIITDIKLPEDLLNSQLQSGLPNNISAIVRIYNDKKIIKKIIISSIIVYDLWDETYTLETINADKIVSKEYKSKTKLIEDLKLINLAINNQTSNEHSINNKLKISLQIIYNPVNEQKIKRIKDWIMASRGHSQSGDFHIALDSREELTLHPSNGLRFQKLFEKLVEDYVPDEGFSAQWKSDLEYVELKQIEVIHEN